MVYNLEPFPRKPSVEEVQGRLRLIHGYHMAGTEDSHEGKVSAGLECASLLAVKDVTLEILGLCLVEILLARPLESFSPGLITEPVAIFYC